MANDQLLLGWSFNTMTLEMASQMMHCTASNGLWETTRSLVGAQTKSRITLFKNELQRTRKGNMRMEEYLNKMKSIANNLTLARCPLPVNDLIL